MWLPTLSAGMLLLALATSIDAKQSPADELASRCATGKLDAEFEAACRAVVLEDVRGASLPPDFFGAGPWGRGPTCELRRRARRSSWLPCVGAKD
ncbi:MAG: hypothetical protein GY711_33090 [bacterium]|nr:hypothetical protein [bacterium]